MEHVKENRQNTEEGKEFYFGRLIVPDDGEIIPL